MLIRELEAKTGLDRAAIRFYEREGLITPERLRNSYRDYSQEDTDTLLKIRLLRQLGTGLDQIQKLQQGSGELNELVQVQIELPDVQKNTLDAAKSIPDGNNQTNTYTEDTHGNDQTHDSGNSIHGQEIADGGHDIHKRGYGTGTDIPRDIDREQTEQPCCNGKHNI